MKQENNSMIKKMKKAALKLDDAVDSRLGTNFRGMDEAFFRILSLPFSGHDQKTWKKRPKTRYLKGLMSKAGMSKADMARYLDCSKQYLDNKMNRDSFTLDDYVIAAHACGYTLCFSKDVGSNGERDLFRIDFDDYFKDYKDDVPKRLSRLKRTEEKAKRAEYNQKKAELEKMKKEYGFDD